MATYLKIEVLPIQENELVEYRKDLLISRFTPKVGNATKPDTVARKKKEGYTGLLSELQDNMSLSPVLSEIVCASVLVAGNEDEKEIHTFTGSEEEIILEIVDTILANKNKGPLVSFNGSGFDIPFLIYRLIMCGVTPDVLDKFIYTTKFHLDLCHVIQKVQYGNMKFAEFVQMKFGKTLQYPWISYSQFCTDEGITASDEAMEKYKEYLKEGSIEYVKFLYYGFQKPAFKKTDKFEPIEFDEETSGILKEISEGTPEDTVKEKKETPKEKPKKKAKKKKTPKKKAKKKKKDEEKEKVNSDKTPEPGDKKDKELGLEDL